MGDVYYCMNRFLLSSLVILAFIGCQSKKELPNVATTSDYASLVALFKEWRSFEKPPLLNGAPDYSATAFQQRMPQFKNLQARLLAIDTTRWPIPQRVDWHLVWAEMNGYDFNFRVLQPWVRDPAYYKVVWPDRSDVPSHEGPTNHGTIELWTYSFPLTEAAKIKLISQLQIVKPFYDQAQQNLTGNAEELWKAGIRDIVTQAQDLQDILLKPGVSDHPELVAAVQEATHATSSFAAWLEEEAEKKTDPPALVRRTIPGINKMFTSYP